MYEVSIKNNMYIINLDKLAMPEILNSYSSKKTPTFFESVTTLDKMLDSLPNGVDCLNRHIFKQDEVIMSHIQFSEFSECGATLVSTFVTYFEFKNLDLVALNSLFLNKYSDELDVLLNSDFETVCEITELKDYKILKYKTVFKNNKS